MEAMQQDSPASSHATQEGGGDATSVIAEENKHILHVRDLLEDADEEEVAEYFEHHRRGGFKVEKVELLPESSSALVYFESPAAVEAMLQKGPFKINKKEVKVGPYSPATVEEPAEGAENGRILHVRDLHEDADEEEVADYFEHERRGGFKVEKVELLPDSSSALVYFESPTAVEAVLQKGPFKIRKKEVKVGLYSPATVEEPAEGAENRFILHVRDLHEDADDEDVADYFAHKRRGGFKVEKVELLPDSSSALVYFESPEALEAVLQKGPFKIKKKEVKVGPYAPATVKEPAEGAVTERVCEKTDHVLMEHDLKVSLHRAQPACPDRVFLTGLPVQVTRDSLNNFLVAWTKLTPKDIRFGEEEGTALVVFDSEIDMKSLKSALRENKLEDSTLEAQPVLASKAVLVKGKDPDITKDNLELYFDNTSKSGGEGLQEVEKLGEGTWLVSFARHQVARLVSKRTHCMRGIDLEVSLYMDCLGPEGGNPEPRSFPIPSPLSIPVSHPLLLRFLEHSLSQGKEFKELMALHHAQANLDDGTELTVTCTLTRETPCGKRLAKTWTNDVKNAVNDFLAKLDIRNIRMSSTVFEEVVKEMDSFQQNEDNVLVHNEEKSSTIQVAGCPQTVDDIVKEINTIKEKHEAEFERRRQTVDETITTLKPHELEYLDAIDFSHKAKENSQGLEVAVVCSKGEVKFKGLFEHVQPAREKMFELLQSLQPERLAISHSQESIIKTEKVQQYLRNKMQENKLVVVWEVADRELKLWAATDEALVKAAYIVKAAVQEKIVPLDPESVALLSSKEWDIRKKVQGHDGVTIITEDKIQGNYTVTSLEESLSPALEALQNFFKENTLYKQQLRFPPGRQGFLTKHLDIHELQNNNRAHHVRITPGEVFRVEGTKDGLARVKNELEALAASVKSKPHPEADKAFITFLKSPRGREAIVLAEKDTRCVIRETDDDTDKPTIVDVLSRPKNTLAADGYQVIPRVKLFVTEDDITAMKVNAVVIAANDNLRHNGGLARDISLKAGPSLETECDDYISQHGPLQEGEVWVSGAGSLPYQRVIHAVGPRWSGGQSEEEAKLKNAVTGSLQAADNLSLASLAMPAIRTGIFRYPVKEAIQVMVEAIMEYFKSNSSSTLREIHLVADRPEFVQHFHDAAAKLFTVIQTNQSAATHTTSISQITKHLATGTDMSTASKTQDTPGFQVPVPVAVKGDAVTAAPLPSATGVGLQAVQGELATQEADVLVNTTSPRLQLTQGAVSKSLLAAGGDTLQQEIVQNYPHGLPSGQRFVITSAGTLKAKKIFHTALPKWKNNGEKFLRGLLEKCVREADSMGFSSIAFPALGTGQLNYPRDVVARCFQDVASSLLPGCCSLQEIRVVLFPSDHESIQAFQSVMQTKDGSATVPQSGTGGDARTHAFVVGGMNITVKQGNILREEVDIIVKGSNSNLDLGRGAVSTVILPDYQAECKDRETLRKMQKSGMAMTSYKGLQCSYILHVDAVGSHADWKGAIFKCLKEAAKRKASIAFPALGTGNRGLDPEDAAKAFGEAFMQMDKDNLDVSLRDIRIVIFQKDMFLKFVTAMQTQLNTRDPKKVGWIDAVKAMVADWIRKITVKQPTTTDADIRDSIVNAAIALYFFSDDANEIQKALAIIDEKFHSEHLERPFQSEVIKHLASEQVKELENLAQRHSVEVFVDQAKGEVIIKGLSANVHEAMNDLLKITESEHRDTTPKHWAPMNDKEVMTVPLSPSDQEYKETEALFQQTIRPHKVAVVQIERVQNRTLYNQYMTKRKAMEKQHTSSNPVERKLWHGTKGPCTDDINKTGFNRSFAGENAAVYGNGVYFAVNSSYSARPTYSPEDDNGLRRMYLAQVLTGDYTLGKQGMKTPPRKNDKSLYDSLVNNEQNIEMFVVFNDTQAYPEFLVTFK